MSQRPRLAGDGLLRQPEKVALFWNDLLHGRLSEGTVDPFDWTEDRLLLAESFARLDLQDRDAAKAWFTRHGVVDRAGFVGPPSEAPGYSALHEWLAERDPRTVADHRRDIEVEQATIRWHLATLARLSERRSTRDWDPAWGRLIIDGPDGDLIVGGPDAGSWLTLPATIDVLRREFPDDPQRRHQADEAERLRAATDGWPVVEVGEFLWYDSWERDEPAPDGPLPSDPEGKARVLGTTWDLTVALERLLIMPYVARAVERRFTAVFEPSDVGGVTRSMLVPREERVWQSILAPIHLQLFEALRRITEGEPGAAVCRECGQPFLVLDARRRFFCNAREQFRHSKREQRRRIIVVEATDADPEREAMVEELSDEEPDER
jgi:hypothetical protein